MTGKSKTKQQATTEESEMSFLEHLEILRWHVIRSLIAVVVIAIVIYNYKKFVFDTIIMGPKKASFITYKWFCNISESMCFTPPKLDIINVGMAEQFLVSLKVSFFLGVILAFPYIFWEIWRFVKPGLYETERRVTRGVVLICSFLFFAGVLFGYYLISPFAINFLAGVDLGLETQNTTTLDSYVTYMTMFTVPTGIVFELPIAMFFLSKIGVVTPEFLRKYRRHAFIIILILAAIITPPDVVTQFMIGIPVFFLYEMSIHISAWVQRKSKKEVKS